jgi:AraC family transcriptional regulator
MHAASIGWLLPALVHAQTNLDATLSVAELAATVDRSPSHFARRFATATGETPGRHLERLRLKRGARLLVTRDATILEIALDCGYASHETFTRAFVRRFGLTPSRWRAAAVTRRASDPQRPRAQDGLEEELAIGHLSETRVRRLRPLQLLFVRHVGPYEDVPVSLWDELPAAAVRLGAGTDGHLVGVAHDAPGITDPSRLRFDAGLVVHRTLRVTARESGIGFERIEGGTFAITTHIGPYASIPAAYESIVERLRAMAQRIEIIGVPSIELYHTTRIDPVGRLNQTDIAIPVVERT